PRLLLRDLPAPRPAHDAPLHRRDRAGAAARRPRLPPDGHDHDAGRLGAVRRAGAVQRLGVLLRLTRARADARGANGPRARQGVGAERRQPLSEPRLLRRLPPVSARPSRLLEALARAGGPVQGLAIRLDAVRGLGARGAIRRMRAERALAGLGTEPRDAVYRRIWGDAADRLGAEVVELGDGFLELRRARAATRVWQQYTELDDAVALELALHRPIVFALLEDCGVPVPGHTRLRLDELDAALAFLERQPDGCVVKPAAGTGVGSGITSGIRTADQLRRAALRASQYGESVIERHVP